MPIAFTFSCSPENDHFCTFHLLFCLTKMSAVVSQVLKVQKCTFLSSHRVISTRNQSPFLSLHHHSSIQLPAHASPLLQISPLIELGYLSLVLHFPIFCRLFSAKVLELTLAQECIMNSRVESSVGEHFEKVMGYTKPSTQKHKIATYQ